MLRRRIAQSILEYIVVLSAIVGTVLWATASDGPVRKAIKNMFQDSSDLITSKTTTFLNEAAGGVSGK